MVLRNRDRKMASEQPVKKKLRITDEDDPRDETDFIHSTSDTIMRGDLSRLHLTHPAPTLDVPPECELSSGTVLTKQNGNAVHRTLSVINAQSSPNPVFYKSDSAANGIHLQLHNNDFNITSSSVPKHVNVPPPTAYASDQIVPNASQESPDEMVGLQNQLIRQCLCGVSETTLRKPFQGTRPMAEWPVNRALQFLSNLQLLFDVYLKQNNKGYICSRICDICDVIVRNEHNMIDQIIQLGCSRNKYVNYLSARVLSSFLIMAKSSVHGEWLETIVGYLTTEPVDYVRMNFGLEVIKRVVEWKDVDIHKLEEDEVVMVEGSSLGPGTSRTSAPQQSDAVPPPTTCTTVSFTDHESFDTSPIKCLVIKSLESKWPDLIRNIQMLIVQDASTQSQNCVLTFLSLWESIISVKANLSVVDTKPFYAHLEHFAAMLLNHALPAVVWRQLLSLFNEVLCYGSTLALQDMLPEETCKLAHLVVRYVKDYRLLDGLPYRRAQGHAVHSFVGTIATTDANQSCKDKTLLQKMVLLVLKSVAITVKETRCDSSDSSVGSDDYDFYQDMQLIERSIRDVLKKVDVFIKNGLEFHPETSFSKILIHLFSDQDDYMIESMVCTLDITVGIYYRNSVFPDLIAMLNPSCTFIEFLKMVSHDYDVLLDFLVSNETCFLLYLLRFLKYVRRNWSNFVMTCETSSSSSDVSRTINELDETMTVLIRLRHQISRLVNKQLFPYNINPVLRLLEMCESLYEGNELS